MTSLADALRAAWRDPRGRLGATALCAIAAIALAGPAFLPDPAHMFDPLEGTGLSPGPGHWLGTDSLSRDVLSRVVSGARVSLAVSLVAVALSMSLGGTLGLVSGYLGGAADAALMRVVDGALAIPRLFLLLLVLAAAERLSLPMLIGMIGATGWFAAARLIRGEVLRLREEPYVAAAEALGAPRRRVIFQHLLPNTIGPLLVAATLAVGDVILLEAGLSFLGLGVQPPTPSWGGMILDAKPVLVSAPWAGIFPGMAIVITVLSVNLFGDALRDAMDPRSG